MFSKDFFNYQGGKKMRKVTLLFTACFISLALIFSAGSAHADAYSQADAGLWVFDDSLTGEVGYEWGAYTSGTNAIVADDNASDVDPGVEYSYAETGYASGQAWAETGDGFYLEEYTVAYADGIGNSWAYAEASAEFTQELIVEGQGEITFYAQYWLWQELETLSLGDSASAYSEASLSWWREGEFSRRVSTVLLSPPEFSDGEGDEFYDEGILQITIPVDTGPDGAIVYLGGRVYNTSEVSASATSTSVPEPNTLLLLGSGLIGLGWCRKRIKS